jgi:hypothetical protein
MNWQKYKSTEDLVKNILKDKPKTRGDDIELILTVWEYQGLNLTESQKAIIRKCHSSEAITRARRRIQQSGLFMPNNNIVQQRSFLQDTFRKNFENKNA